MIGKLEAARLLFEEAVQVSKETLGDGHPYTLVFTKHLDLLLKAMLCVLAVCGVGGWVGGWVGVGAVCMDG